MISQESQVKELGRTSTTNYIKHSKETNISPLATESYKFKNEIMSF